MNTIMSFLLYIFIAYSLNAECSNQYGPEPWHYEPNERKIDSDVPSDLQLPLPSKQRIETNNAISDWFFKRVIAILLKGGQIKKNEDNSIDIFIQMKFPAEQWKLLNEYTSSPTALTEDMLRRSVGYVEEAFYKPTLTEKIAMAWSDYIQVYLSHYKVEITWTFIILSAVIIIFHLYQRMSHKHLVIVLLLGLYTYEVFVSYMESEREEYENFIKAVNRCKWYFWSSTCEIPQPNPLIFIKHMHPLKIGIRMISTIVTEPMVYISSTIHVMLHGITDGLWYPLNNLVYGMLVIVINVLLIIFLIMILFNFILNIPFKLSFFAGLINIGVSQRNRTLFSGTTTAQTSSSDGGDRLSGQNIEKLLNLVSRVVNSSDRESERHIPVISNKNVKEHKSIKKSSSAGRLTDLIRLPYETKDRYEATVKSRHRNHEHGDRQFDD